MGYRTLCEGSGIHHSNSGLQITPDKYINGFFILLFDLTPELTASEGHTSGRVNGHIRLEFKFGRPPGAIGLFIVRKYDNSVLIYDLRTVTTDF